MNLLRIRRDLEFFPIQHQGQQFVLIRDSLGLVDEGKAVGLPLYRIMALLDGAMTLRDLQTVLMQHQGGMLVSRDEINSLMTHLDESFLLDSERYQRARDAIIADFTSRRVRPCSHCGKSYPENPLELKDRLDEILQSLPASAGPEGRMVALIAPHVDLTVGFRGYSAAYQMLNGVAPSRIIILGIGHHLQNGLFSITDKDFETPLGIARADQEAVGRLRESGRNIIAPDDFVHRSEHSIEFQIIFVQHLLNDHPVEVVPILCGSLQTGIPEYGRQAYQETAGPFLETLRRLLHEPEQDTLIVAGVDFFHIGPKFGHDLPAAAMENQARTHDQNLLKHLTRRDADGFWEESRDVRDRFNVCGFSALACLLEILPECRGEVLHYEIWHEAPTRSAVSFASTVFTT
ncbi:MAG: AmmeMemoRadiSam system protein B [Deltaproteobacteria bacterium]|nr:AmmeMemoRadiSam system protein B [Deltaproteobacteria bacterium]